MLNSGRRPAACQVEPAVSSVRSISATSAQPFLVRGYSVLTPTTPPPMTRTRTCVFTWAFSSNDAARGFAEKLRYIGDEGAPHLDAKHLRFGAPEHDFGLRQHGARAHARREGARIQIQRAAGGEQCRGLRAAHHERALAVAHIHE